MEVVDTFNHNITNARGQKYQITLVFYSSFWKNVMVFVFRFQFVCNSNISDHKFVKTIYIHSKDAGKDFQMQQNQAIFITWYIKVAYADKKYSQDCIFWKLHARNCATNIMNPVKESGNK